jgi:hypothetical protein
MRCQSKNGKVVALCGTTREDDFFGLGSYHFRNLNTSMFNSILRALPI